MKSPVALSSERHSNYRLIKPASFAALLLLVIASVLINASHSSGSASLKSATDPLVITAATGLSRDPGATSNSQIATVTGGVGPATVTVTSANPSNGVTISNIVNTSGTVTADIAASCAATSASFTLQADDGSSTTTDTLNVTVNPGPATPTASNGGPYCEGATISLSTPTVTGATYAWTGPNAFTSSQQNPTLAKGASADAGTYSVTVTVNGCTSAAGTTNVVVNATPATPTINAGGPTTFCQGGNVTLTSSSASGNQWYKDGNLIGGETNQQYVANA